ncbi:MAG: hypothetical protein ACXVLQ_08445 [Bacteriovorax sp.]
MIKKFFGILLIIVLLSAGLLYWKLSSKRTLITPYPYSFNANAVNAFLPEIKEAESAKILIVGDRMAGALANYTPELENALSKNFKSPPKIYNWSRPHEGLHRTLFKLKSLNKFPPIIIYHGASSELFEKTFSVSDKNAIMRNFSLFDDERIISLIITFPWLSKIFYQKTQHFELGPFKEYQNRLSSMDKMNEKEVSFKLFDYELRELVDLIKDKKSNLILMTTPLNLEVPPKEVCSSSTSNTIIEVQQEIEALIEHGNFKKAYSDATELQNETLGNAKSFYLLGIASMRIGDLKTAREALQRATVFDCMNWRGNAVYNAIIKNEAKRRQVALIDFDLYMSSALSKEGLFRDELFPQNLFYQTMMEELKETVKKILSVND